MIQLPMVTILQINCVDPDVGVKSIQYSCRGINFGKRILLSHERPHNLTDDIQFYQIPKLDHSGISKFRFDELYKYVETDYYLSIQTDGFVINPHIWTDEFLEYDYIGAPWPSLPWNRLNRVGNGGFRLESRKLLRLCANIMWDGSHDDVLITNTFRDYFESHGCKFPSVELAARFSLEHKIDEVEYNLNNCFGFHGKLTDDSKAYVEMIKQYEL